MKNLIPILLAIILLTGCNLTADRETEEAETVKISGNSRLSAITDYLESQEYFAWKTEEDSKNFCAFYPFNAVNEDVVYVWARCSELSAEGTVLKEDSGVSVPVKLEYPAELSYLDHTQFTHEVPRDGSFYSEDMEKIFPEDIRNRMGDEKNLMLSSLNSELIQRAAEYFGVDYFTEIPFSLMQTCEEDAECETPFNFLVQSNCPFESLCVENKCRVVCPLIYHDLNPEISESHTFTCEKDEDCDCGERGERTIECVCSQGNCFSVEQ